MASSNSEKMIHLNIWSYDKMLDPIEDCVPWGYKVSQDCKTEVLSLLQFPCDSSEFPTLCFAHFPIEQKTKSDKFNSGYKWHFDGRKAFAVLAVQQGLLLLLSKLQIEAK